MRTINLDIYEEWSLPVRCPDCNAFFSVGVSLRSKPRQIKGVYCVECGEVVGDTAHWQRVTEAMRDRD